MDERSAVRFLQEFHHLVLDAMGVVTVFTNFLSWPSCNSLP